MNTVNQYIAARYWRENFGLPMGIDLKNMLTPGGCFNSALPIDMIDGYHPFCADNSLLKKHQLNTQKHASIFNHQFAGCSGLRVVYCCN